MTAVAERVAGQSAPSPCATADHVLHEICRSRTKDQAAASVGESLLRPICAADNSVGVHRLGDTQILSQPHLQHASRPSAPPPGCAPVPTPSAVAGIGETPCQKGWLTSFCT